MHQKFDMTGVPETDRGPWMQTYYGRKLHFLDPRPEDIDPRDIAGALGNLCRFTGQCTLFYSVAQHSVYCTQIGRERGMSKDDLRYLLMHDAAEAYLSDVNRPLKSLLPEYRDIEARVLGAITDRFGLKLVEPKIMREIDNVAMATEKIALMPNASEWPGMPEVEKPRLFTCLDPVMATAAFWKEFVDLFPEDPAAGGVVN